MLFSHGFKKKKTTGNVQQTGPALALRALMDFWKAGWLKATSCARSNRITKVLQSAVSTQQMEHDGAMGMVGNAMETRVFYVFLPIRK